MGHIHNATLSSDSSNTEDIAQTKVVVTSAKSVHFYFGTIFFNHDKQNMSANGYSELRVMVLGHLTDHFESAFL